MLFFICLCTQLFGRLLLTLGSPQRWVTEIMHRKCSREQQIKSSNLCSRYWSVCASVCSSSVEFWLQVNEGRYSWLIAVYNIGFSPSNRFIKRLSKCRIHLHLHRDICQDRDFHLTPSLSVHAVMCSVVRKVDSFHEKIRQTFGAVAASVKRRYKHIENGSYEADWQSEKQ